MKKNKLYLILAILSTIFLISFAAVCNQCGTAAAEEEESAEEAAEEEVAEEEAEEEEVAEEEEEEAEEEKEVPTISISIYEGPTYNPADGVCYYRIKATVTGSPSPDVDWSKDDSNSAWGTRKAQVNLEDPGDTYTLTATATNLEGTDTDSIELSWGCEVENQDPIISEITLMGTKYTNIQYTISAAASDPDGDSLTYKWVITNTRGDPNGTIIDDSVSAMKWTTPPTPGEYKIEVSVDDGKGGEATANEIVDVHFLYDLLAKAPSADWYSIDLATDLWNIGLSDSHGFACYRTNITLEDNTTYSKVLETHPEWINNGYIGGEYPDIIKIPEGARFTARVGFIKDATGTDGVRFFILFRDTSYVIHYIGSTLGFYAAYNGALDSLDLDLSTFAGQSGQIILIVKAGTSSTQDWAVWVNPQIAN